MQNKHQFFLGAPNFRGGGQAGWDKIPSIAKNLFWRLPLLFLPHTNIVVGWDCKLLGLISLCELQATKLGAKLCLNEGFFSWFARSCLPWHELSFHFSVATLPCILKSYHTPMFGKNWKLSTTQARPFLINRTISLTEGPEKLKINAILG